MFIQNIFSNSTAGCRKVHLYFVEKQFSRKIQSPAVSNWKKLLISDRASFQTTSIYKTVSAS